MHNKSRGNTLIIGMLALVLATGIALTSVEQSNTAQKATNSAVASNTLGTAVNSAIAEGAAWLTALYTAPTKCSTGATSCSTVYNALTVNPATQSASWWSTRMRTTTRFNLTDNPSITSLGYLIEEISCQTYPNAKRTYRVTGYGVATIDGQSSTLTQQQTYTLDLPISATGLTFSDYAYLYNTLPASGTSYTALTYDYFNSKSITVAPTHAGQIQKIAIASKERPANGSDCAINTTMALSGSTSSASVSLTAVYSGFYTQPSTSYCEPLECTGSGTCTYTSQSSYFNLSAPYTYKAGDNIALTATNVDYIGNTPTDIKSAWIGLNGATPVLRYVGDRDDDIVYYSNMPTAGTSVYGGGIAYDYFNHSYEQTATITQSGTVHKIAVLLERKVDTTKSNNNGAISMSLTLTSTASPSNTVTQTLTYAGGWYPRSYTEGGYLFSHTQRCSGSDPCAYTADIAYVPLTTPFIVKAGDRVTVTINNLTWSGSDPADADATWIGMTSGFLFKLVGSPETYCY